MQNICFDIKEHLVERLFVAASKTRKFKLNFFSIGIFFHDYSRITGVQGKGEGISLTPHYHFHPLHIHLFISRVVTAESLSLHIDSSRTPTGNLWYLSERKSLATKLHALHALCIRYVKETHFLHFLTNISMSKQRTPPNISLEYP